MYIIYFLLLPYHLSYKKNFTLLSELFPFIQIDVRSFAYYFRKNKGEDNIAHNMIIQLSHEFLDTAHMLGQQNSSGDIDQKITFIHVFTFREFIAELLIKMRCS
jgi:hypothetical protein